MTSAREVRREKREHEEAEVPREPRRLFVREVGREACDLDRHGSSHGEGEGLDPAARRVRRLVITRENQLLPQSAAVLAGELPGDRVEIAHPLHGDQEPLVGCEARLGQLGDLVAEMVLELVDVVAVDRRRAGDIGPPLCDLRLDALHPHASPAAASRPPEPGQTSFSARVMASHCRC